MTLAAPPAEEVRASAAVPKPRRIHFVEPKPAVAAHTTVHAIAILEIRLDEAGVPAGITTVYGGIHADEAVYEAVRQWRYEPLASLQ